MSNSKEGNTSFEVQALHLYTKGNGSLSLSSREAVSVKLAGILTAGILNGSLLWLSILCGTTIGINGRQYLLTAVGSSAIAPASIQALGRRADAVLNNSLTGSTVVVSIARVLRDGTSARKGSVLSVSVDGRKAC